MQSPFPVEPEPFRLNARGRVKKASAKKKLSRSWELTVFLTKEGVKTWQDALVEPKRKVLPAHEDINGVGTLVIKDAPERVPWWVERLGDHSKLVKGLRQRSPGAVLFVPVKKRLFALTFGYGRSLLAPERLVHDFGIRVVLNSVDPSRLRSIDLRTLEADPLLSKKQFGEGRPLASFGVDTYRDLLRGVAGSPGKDKPVLSGSDAVHLRLQLSHLGDIASECARLLRAGSAKTYQKDFAWIDHVRLVRDHGLKLQLEDALYNDCSTGSSSEVRYIVPEVRDGHQLERLRGSWERRSDSVLDSDAVRERLRHRATGRDAKTFIQAIKADRVGEPSLETGVFTQSWSLFDCVLWTADVGGNRYVLTSGDWFELDADFIATVEAYFDKLVARHSPLKLPAATALNIPKKSYYELEYNKAAAQKKSLTNLDRTSMMKGLGATGVEPCDLLHPTEGVFIHVKDGRSSAMLSHLFNQGVVALEGFLSVTDARATVRALAKLPKTGVGPLHEPIVPSKLKVLFAIIDRKPSSGGWRLPFFSMLAAKYAAERIERLQATPLIVRIDDRRP